MSTALAVVCPRKYQYQTEETANLANVHRQLKNHKVKDQSENEGKLLHLRDENESPNHNADFLILQILLTTVTMRRTSKE